MVRKVPDPRPPHCRGGDAERDEALDELPYHQGRPTGHRRRPRITKRIGCSLDLADFNAVHELARRQETTAAELLRDWIEPRLAELRPGGEREVSR